MSAPTPFLLSLSLIAAAFPLSAGAADFTVNSIADSGAGSLRQAILDANAAPNAPGATDVISIALPVAGNFPVINVSGSLPEITDPVTINGSTQINPVTQAPATGVEIRSSGMAAGQSLLTVSGGGSVLRNLAIVSESAETVGISLIGGNSNTLSNLRIGLTAGNVGLSDGRHGVVVASDHNTLSDSLIGQAAHGDGIRVTGNHNRLLGNTLGLKVGSFTGTAKAACKTGIHLIGGLDNRIEGGVAATLICASLECGVRVEGGSGHFVSAALNANSQGLLDPLWGNTGVGVQVDSGAANIQLYGMGIQGTDGAGISIAGATDVTVSGGQVMKSTGHGIVLGNGVGGILIEDCSVTANVGTGIHMEGGLDTAGTVLIRHNLIGDNGLGVDVVSGMGQVTIGTRRAEGHGTFNLLPASNFIYFNREGGVVVRDPAARVRVSENAIQPVGAPAGNPVRRLAINLLPPGETAGQETANDDLDADTGPNGLQNKPVITRVAPVSYNSHEVSAELRAKPSTSYVIEAYQMNPGVAAPWVLNPLWLFDEFPTAYLLSQTVTTDAAGLASIAMTFQGYKIGWKIALTATSPDGETSELSNAEANGFTAPGPVTEFPSLMEQTAISLPESNAATGSTFTLARPAGVTGAVDASLTITPNFSMSSPPAGFVLLRYRLSPTDAWSTLSPGAALTIPFTAAETVRNIQLSSMDDTSWDPAFKSSDLTVTFGSVTKAIQVTSPDNDPPPVVRLAYASIDSGPAVLSETGQVLSNRFRFVLDRPVSGDMQFKVTLNAVQSTAVLGQDFSLPPPLANNPTTVGVSGSLSEGLRCIMPTIPVSPVDDALIEGPETIVFNFVSVTPGITFSTVASLTLEDNDFLNASIGDASVAEGQSGTSQLNFPVTLSTPVNTAVTFNWSTSTPANAASPSDFTAASGTVTIPAGSTAASIMVEVNGDSLVEPDETFAVTLSNPSLPDVVLSDATAVGTIQNDDFPTVSVADATVLENLGFVVLSLTLSEVSAVDVYVNLTGIPGSASASLDYYDPFGPPVRIPAGSSGTTTLISIRDDPFFEGAETFGVQLTTPVNASLGRSLATVTILDNDVPSLRLMQMAYVVEGDTGSQTVPVTFSLSERAFVTCSANWQVADPATGIAAASGTVTFLPGEDTVVVNLTLSGNLTPQNSRVAKLSISQPLNLTSPPEFAAVNITDNDERQITGGSVSLLEGNGGTTIARIPVGIGSPLDVPVSFHYQTVNGTAAGGSDYTDTSGMATIPAGSSSTEITVTILTDAVLEANETFALQLSSPVNAVLGAVNPTVTIQNDDAQPTLSASPATVTTGPGGPFRAWIEVRLPDDAGALAIPVSYLVRTRDGTARAGTHYTAINSGTLTFPADNGTSSSQWIAVEVAGIPSGSVGSATDFSVDFSAVTGPAATVSVQVKIEPLRISEFSRLGSGFYTVSFPTGVAQNYVIQQASSLAGPWTDKTGVIPGSGSPVQEFLLFSSAPRAYFRVRSFTTPPAAPAVLTP